MYRVVDAMVIRAATRRCTDGMPGWPDLADTSDGRIDRWRTWLRQVWQMPGITAAVEAASPILVRRVERTCAGCPVDERDIRSAVRSVVRYLLRAVGRATPFGLFAGVTTARLGYRGPDLLGAEHRPFARIENDWLTVVITRLESSSALREHLLVVRNNLAFVRDGRLAVGCQQSGTGEPGEASVRHTAATRTILHAAKTPIRLADLAAKLATDFPRASADSIDSMLAGLVAQRILISNLRPPMTATDPLSHVVAALAAVRADTVPDVAELARDLTDLHSTVRRHNNAPSPTRDLRLAAERQAASISVTPRPVSLDLRLNASVELPQAVAREAAAAAAVLVRLAPHPFGSPAWQDYHGRFLERYGVGAMVPVEELLHSDTGLGFPAGYRGSRLASPARPGLSERDEALLVLAQSAVLRNTEVVLDEALIAELARVDVAELRVQPHTELRVRVHAATSDALRGGDFELEIAGVARTAGATTGRFLDLFREDDRDRMCAAYSALPTVVDGARPVQVSCPTLYPRADNVARTPAVLPHHLSLSEHQPVRDGVVEVSDLAVVGDVHRLYLWSLSKQAPVQPVVFSAVEFVNHAHPMVRFLCEVSTARGAACAPFSWGVASRLPVLPRVRYQHTILAAARWVLTSADLPNAIVPFSDWTIGLAEWRKQFRMPAQVYLGDSDRRMRLDLTEPAHLDLLRTEVDRAGRVALREAPDESAFGWLGGHAHEVVIPLAATTPPVPRPRWPRRVVVRDHGHLPGASTWLYIKLYGHPDRENVILTNHLAELLSTWDEQREWWFLRYCDPEPHLRFRFRLLDPHEFGHAATRVAAWASDLRRHGLVAHMQIDTYHPETGRFGPGAAMAAAEGVFAADSAATIAQLTATGGHSDVYPQAFVAASMVDLAIATTGSIDAGMRWLVEHATTPPAPAPVRAVHTAAIRLASPTNDWAALRAVPGGDRIAQAWQRRRTTLNAYRAALATENTNPNTVLADLLHLHNVRMTGINPDAERACTRLARAAALSWTTRTRRAS
jgi:thiopeptide-type bacteriocin biosynthesis protein